jgi:hypothetical protein
MPFQFNIEGPETKKQRELQMQNAELNARILQRSLEKEDPMVRGKQIDESLAIFNDPNSTQGQKSAAWARMNELSGSRMVEGFGQVPLAIPQNEVDRNLYERTEAMANRLEFMNQQIQEAKASGNMARAASLEQARDIQFKSAKENWKKLPIKSAEDLADIKSVIDLGQQALTAVRPDLYGPIDAPLGALGASVGMAPDYTKMNQAFAGVRNQILKARSGGAVTPQEADRFIEEIGTPMAGDFGDRLQLFTVQRKGEYMNKLQALQDAGYEIPDSLKFSTSRVGTQQGAQAPAGQGAGQAGERPRLKFDAQGNYIPEK